MGKAVQQGEDVVVPVAAAVATGAAASVPGLGAHEALPSHEPVKAAVYCCEKWLCCL